MENFIGWFLMISLVVIPFTLVFGGYMLWQRQQRKHKERLNEATQRREAAYQQWKDQHYGTKVTAPSSSYSKPATSSSTTTSTSTSNDNLLSDLATMYVLNAALQHDSASAKVDYDTGTIKTDHKGSSSWGLDDSDSRRSAESTFSSSDSSSSWSSDSSSSSSWDSGSSSSGPSSDW